MYTRIIKSVLITSFLILCINTLFSQITTKELPISFSESTLQTFSEMIILPPPDMKKIHEEDAINDKIPGVLNRVAVAIPMQLNSNSDGCWEKLTNGDQLN